MKECMARESLSRFARITGPAPCLRISPSTWEASQYLTFARFILIESRRETSGPTTAQAAERAWLLSASMPGCRACTDPHRVAPVCRRVRLQDQKARLFQLHRCPYTRKTLS